MPPFKLFALDDWGMLRFNSYTGTKKLKADQFADIGRSVKQRFTVSDIQPPPFSVFQNESNNQSDSCVEPLTLTQLQSFDPSRPILQDDLPLTYGPARGVTSLRSNISALYSPDAGIDSEDVLVTSGAIAANYLVLETLISAGDHVIIQHPTYGQLIEIPRRLGAEVSLWKWRLDQPSSNTAKWTLDLDELASLIRPNTKLIVITNPSNPTGAVTDQSELQHVIDLARSHNNGILVMCDEVFRHMHHSTIIPQPPSLLELGYEKAIVTGSVSKAYALPGVRIGWIATSPALRDTVLEQIAQTRDYTSITVSQVDQQIASFALTPGAREKLLARSADICRRNISILESWAGKNKHWTTYVPAQGGGTCVLRVFDEHGEAVDDAAFSDKLAKEGGVLVPPAGFCFAESADGTGETGLGGWLRVGIVTEGNEMKESLRAIERLGLHQRR